MGFFHGICRSEVIVFSGVDDYSGKAIDNATHVLIHKSTLHVDVSE